MTSLFNIVLYEPLLNFLIFIYNLTPGRDFGLAIVILTIVIRLVLMPLSVKALVSQRNVMKIQPKLKELQTKYKNDKQALTKETMALYKEHGVNPFSGCLPILIQLPILLALYSVFSTGFKAENLDFLYSFMHNPGTVNQIAFGFLDLAKKSPAMAILAGVFQFIQSKKVNTGQPTAGVKDNPAMAINKQMLYFLPIFITIIAWNLPAGLTLYWAVTTLFSVFEQVYIARRYNPKAESNK